MALRELRIKDDHTAVFVGPFVQTMSMAEYLKCKLHERGVIKVEIKTLCYNGYYGYEIAGYILKFHSSKRTYKVIKKIYEKVKKTHFAVEIQIGTKK